MKKVKKVLIILLAITLYANIGWIVGSYYYKNVLMTPHTELTTLGKVAAGGWSFMTFPDENESSITEKAVIIGVFWPFIAIIITGSWIIWFIPAGGFAKLLGLV